MSDEITIYTDGGGGTSTRDSIGSWAYVALIGNKLFAQETGGKRPTTNNEMEITAVLKALQRFPTGALRIFCDSKYTIGGCEEWTLSWPKRDWKTYDRKPVKNRGLWEEVIVAMEGRRHEIVFVHVKGHSGDHYNEMVDRMCTETMKAMRQKPWLTSYP